MSGLPGPSGPADLAPARWFHLEGEVRRGPVALDEVREHVLDGSIGPETWVWSDGMDDWMRVRDVPALVPPAALRATLTAWPDPAADPGPSGDPGPAGDG